MTLGKVTVALSPITMTHAEGPMPDGTEGQVWGRDARRAHRSASAGRPCETRGRTRSGGMDPSPCGVNRRSHP
ncbi:hypothetical protein CW362_06735 [Streptomyces populi]|uniref:Uncharacterized protein n=1 Tax=Streptomyces populi TaxID=2058924 RepID=A0A2I0SUW7_9ACTN|nr:hypothetical protein CW362_06735 [Streptomyces populi]